VRVLVVDDEERLTRFVARGLRRHGMAVDVAASGDEALRKAFAVPYDVVVLDRGLPGIEGDEVCERLVRARPETAILMLTAAGSLNDRIEGLNLGADDYLGKPFAFAELVARIRAVARRGRGERATMLVHGELSLDTVSRIARRRGTVVPLTPKELAVLEELLRARGGIVAGEQLLERAWSDRVDPLTSTARNTVMRLRQKLGDPPVIETRSGHGYRLL
jgi:DNA-binding response OmpR family regulator